MAQIGKIIAIIVDSKDYVHHFEENPPDKVISEQTYSKKAEKLISEMAIDKFVFKKHKLVTENIVKEFLSTPKIQ